MEFERPSRTRTKGTMHGTRRISSWIHGLVKSALRTASGEFQVFFYIIQVFFHCCGGSLFEAGSGLNTTEILPIDD
jgi:hypothetical protein